MFCMLHLDNHEQPPLKMKENEATSNGWNIFLFALQFVKILQRNLIKALNFCLNENSSIVLWKKIAFVLFALITVIMANFALRKTGGHWLALCLWSKYFLTDNW